jgi:hypothetical protein
MIAGGDSLDQVAEPSGSVELSVGRSGLGTAQLSSQALQR